METQKCLYEILGVESTASNEEIRSAYRKLALRWHPDKIQQSGASAEAREDATIRFQEIGRAYEVLADPSERSWYDSHRSQILSGSSSYSSDFDFNPWPYFSASIFSGYGDTGKGFYAVYGELFNKLHQQEVSFAQAHGLRTPFYPPDMGNLSTAYPQVQKFYSHWLGFSTVKDFAWCDEYKASSGPNRKLRRLMEEENKKIRSKARKEFNETIRRLAAFVKKRDKRVLERQIEVQRLEKEKEEMHKARRKKEEEEKRMKARLYEEAEWTKVEPEKDADDGSDFDESIGSYAWGQSDSKNSGSKNGRQDEFFCIVCNKKFKSDKQWRNHERSKKHLEKVAILKESFEEDDKEFEVILHGRLQADNVNLDIKASTEKVSEVDESPDTSETEVSNKSARKRKETSASDAAASKYPDERDQAEISKQNTRECSEFVAANESDDVSPRNEDDEDDELGSLLSMVNSYTDRHRRSTSEESDEAAEFSASGEDPSDEGSEGRGEDEEEMLAAMLKSHQIREDYKSDEHVEDFSANGEAGEDKLVKLNRDTGGPSKKKKSKGQLRNEKQQAASFNRHAKLIEELMCEEEVGIMTQKCKTLISNEEDSCGSVQLQEKTVMSEKDIACMSKTGKVEKRSNSREGLPSKGKNANGHSMAEVEQLRRLARAKKSKCNGKSSILTCETCGEDFDSRNQLFKHISATKHAVLKGK